MNRLFLALLVICAASFTAMAGFAESSSIDLKYVSAVDAYKTLEDRLGTDAAAAVRSIDVRRNALSLRPDHPQTVKVREFLASFDRRPAQVVVNAVISHRIEAIVTTPAHDEILSRPSIFSPADRPVTFTVPANWGTTKIELRVITIPGQ